MNGIKLDWRIVYKEYKKGLTTRDLAKKYNVSQCKIVQNLKKRGYKLRTLSESHKGQHPLTEFKKGNIPWNKGLTKEIDERIKDNAKKIFESKKEGEGWLGWNKGMDMKKEGYAFNDSRLDISCDNCGKIKKIYPSLLNQYNYHFCNISCRSEFFKNIGLVKGKNNSKYIDFNPDDDLNIILAPLIKSYSNVQKKIYEYNNEVYKKW